MFDSVWKGFLGLVAFVVGLAAFLGFVIGRLM